jgi:RNA polymerase sigma-70 factor (ECF subfamily)
MRDMQRYAASRDAETPGASAGPALAPVAHDFAELYDAWFDHVSRWLRTLGCPESDIEDLAQDVFLVVRRRLVDFDGRNVAGWLYRISSGQVRQHRRRRWFQRVLSLRSPIELEDLPDHRANAAVALETKQKHELLERLLGKMSEKRRVAFRLFEIEGYGGDEIADILDVPVNTVWTRLHYARKDFFTLLAQHRRSSREPA